MQNLPITTIQNLKITTIQTDIIWQDKINNLVKYEETIETITSKMDVIILPEMFTTGFSMETKLREQVDGNTVKWMKDISSEKDAYMMGSIMFDAKVPLAFNRL
jgi:predicted amidohydrolase